MRRRAAEMTGGTAGFSHLGDQSGAVEAIRSLLREAPIS
jgi:hypothetical protein